MSEITPNTPNPVREDAYVEELAEKLGIDPQYIPKSPVWRNEEEIKAIAEMFSNMSGGSSGGGVFMVHASDDNTPVLDKTWQEISDAYTGGSVVICVCMYGDLGYLSSVPENVEDIEYSVAFFGNQFFEQYVASSASGYPSLYTE